MKPFSSASAEAALWKVVRFSDRRRNPARAALTVLHKLDELKRLLARVADEAHLPCRSNGKSLGVLGCQCVGCCVRREASE